jgi:dihydroorotase
MATLSITGGRVIDPASGLDDMVDVVMDGPRIVQIGSLAPDGPRFDASGCIVCPGLIDPHVHLREPGQEEKETIATGAAAALNGGFTSICCMPNTQPALDDDARIEFVYRQTARRPQCHVYPVGAITKGRAGAELAEIGLMARAGAVAFSDDGCAVALAAVMSTALRYVKMTGRAIMQHCEEPTLTEGAAMNAGKAATRLGLAGWPNVAEELIIRRDIMLNRSVGCRYHVQHLSTAEGIEAVRQARQSGQPVTAEASPHHLLLTDECCAGYDPNYKVNPPLRTEVDRQALLAGVRDGTITILATDHAPHTREDKEVDFGSAAFGIIGLDCALGLYARALIEPNILDWPQMIAMMTMHPAQLCNLVGKGELKVGGDADITIIDPQQRWTIDAQTFASRARNCPFDGWEVPARPIATIVDGEVRMNREPGRINA